MWGKGKTYHGYLTKNRNKKGWLFRELYRETCKDIKLAQQNY